MLARTLRALVFSKITEGKPEMLRGDGPRPAGVLRAIAVIMLFASLLTVIGGGVSQTSAQNDQAKQDANLRVVNASPGSPDLDVIVDGTVVAKGVAFGQA